MFTEKKKEEFIIIHDELDGIIEKIVMAKAEYGEYPYNYGSHVWTYEGGKFEIETKEGYVGGYCYDSPDIRWVEVTWEEIFDVENIVENLKKEKIERDRIAAEKKLINEAIEKKRKFEKERVEYNRLKIKFEKS